MEGQDEGKALQKGQDSLVPNSLLDLGHGHDDYPLTLDWEDCRCQRGGRDAARKPEID